MRWLEFSGLFGDRRDRSADQDEREKPFAGQRLYTCVVLMGVAGALLWANLKPQIEQKTDPIESIALQLADNEAGEPTDGKTVTTIKMGWPRAVTKQGTLWITYPEPLQAHFSRSFDSHLVWQWLVPNLVVALAILGGTALACELLIRRRARKPQDPAP